MPKFFVYTPDKPDILAKRLQVRPEHLVRAKEDIASGAQGEHDLHLYFLPGFQSLSGPRLLRLTQRYDVFLPAMRKYCIAHTSELGRPFLPPPDAKPHGLTLPEGIPNIAGTIMFLDMPSRDAVWQRLCEDVYWTKGIWDTDRVIVEEFCP